MQTANTTRKAFGYVRVSTAAQVRDGESLAVQQQMIEAICRLESLSLAGIFVEEGVSGSKPLAARPEGAKLLAALASGDVVIALRLDRMFRNTADALATLEGFKKQGVALYLKDVGGFISGDSVGELVFSLMSSVASFERSRTRERIVEVRTALKKQGRYMGGDVPFGYRLIQRDGEQFTEPDTDLLAEVAGLKANGYSTRLIAGHFAQRGVAVSHHAVARCLNRMMA